MSTEILKAFVSEYWQDGPDVARVRPYLEGLSKEEYLQLLGSLLGSLGGSICHPFMLLSGFQLSRFEIEDWKDLIARIQPIVRYGQQFLFFFFVKFFDHKDLQSFCSEIGLKAGPDIEDWPAFLQDQQQLFEREGADRYKRDLGHLGLSELEYQQIREIPSKLLQSQSGS